MHDLVSNLILQARLTRLALCGANVSRVSGFVYCVEGTNVIRYNPNGTADVVKSEIEMNESLNVAQKALLLQNRRSRIRAL